MTERIRMSFKVKEIPGGQPWICLEPIKEDLIVLGNGFLGFDLPAGTSQAQRCTDYRGNEPRRLGRSRYLC